MKKFQLRAFLRLWERGDQTNYCSQTAKEDEFRSVSKISPQGIRVGGWPKMTHHLQFNRILVQEAIIHCF